MEEFKDTILDFGAPEEKHSIIKVIGVGGGGGNAVNHMYDEGIHDVTFVVCNTDAQALNDSPIPVKLQLGSEGLGAGNRPERARQAAEESREAIKNMLSDGTRMTFITAGMGGGTGTGAAPVVARISKEMGILTVGIVTIPFKFEGPRKIDQALDGVEEMAKYVDALLVINNERLRDICANMSFKAAFAKADDTLTIAAKSIAEIITTHGDINLDFNDVKTVLENGGVAIMSTGYGQGDDRVRNAINDALNSPLLNNNDVYHSKKILLSISHGGGENGGLMMEEMTEVHNFMSQFGNDFEIKWGVATDNTLGDKIKITILATGFGVTDVDGIEERRNLQAELDKKVIDTEKENNLRERRDKFYGPNDGNKRSKRPFHVFIFDSTTLDNDDVISEVESSPTFTRSRQARDRIQSMAQGEAVANTQPEEDTPALISFG